MPRSCRWLLPCVRRKLSWQVKLMYALAFLALLLTILGLIGAYEIAPEYVKQRMAATSLAFSRVELTNPVNPAALTDVAAGRSVAADSGYGFTIVATAVLSGLSPVDGTLDPMPTTLSFGGRTVATFTLPRVRALANVDNLIALSAPVSITDMDAFTAFGQAILLQDRVEFVLAGRATVSTILAGLTFRISDVPFEKTIALAGAAGLKKSEVLEFSLTGSNATTAVAVLTVALENPAVLGIAPLGDLAVNVVYAGAYMGTVLCSNASLLPGTNALRFEGRLTPANVLAADELISRYLAGLPVNVTASATPWATSIPLYLPLLGFVSLNASLSGSSTPLVNAIVVESMFLSPASASSVRVDLNATVIVNNPLGADSPLLVRSVALNVSLEGGGEVLGDLIVPLTPVTAALAARPRRPTSDALTNAPVMWNARFVSPSCKRAVGRADACALAGVLADAPPLPTANISLAVSALLAIDETATEFGNFILLFLNNQTVDLGLVSSDSHAMIVELESALGNLTVHIPLQAHTTVLGIGGFPDVTVNSFTVSGTTNDPPAVLVDLQVSLYNPSPASFPLGANATLGIYVEGHRLGGSTAYNVTLAPGVNVLNLIGTIAPPPDALPATSTLFTNFLKGLPGTALVVGESVFMGGDEPTPQWLQDAVTNLSLSATLPGAQDLTVFAEVQLDAMSFDFSQGETPLISGIVSGNLHLPFSIPVDVVSINTSLVFTDPDTGVPMAGVSLDNQRATYTPVVGAATVVEGSRAGLRNAPIVGTLTVYLDPAPIQLYDLPSFQAFITRILNAPAASVRLEGSASPLVQLIIGNISVSNVSISQQLTIAGMNGLSNPPVVVTSVDILNTSVNTALLQVGLDITNPSILSGNLGPVTLQLESNGIILADSSIAPLLVQPGLNKVVAQGQFSLPDAILHPAAYEEAIAFLSRYLCGQQSHIRMLGSASSSPFPLLAPAFAALNATADFPGLEQQLLLNGTLYLVNLTATEANGTLVATNPLSVPLQLVNASLTVWMCQNESTTQDCLSPDYGPAIGYFYKGDLSLDPINLPARSTSTTKPYLIQLLGTGADDITLFVEILLDGAAITKVNGTITARIGELQATVPYEQYRLPLVLG